MAEVGAVYSVIPVVRTTDDVMAHRCTGPEGSPRANHKWVSPSVVDHVASAIAQVDG